MAWDGYISFGGNEIINGPRTERYARDLPWFRSHFHNDSLAVMLGEQPYESPLQDDAPWTDPNAPESYNFYGLYPLTVDGLEDSTRVAVPTESTGDGGFAGRPRHAMKSIVISGVLVGADDAAVAYGMNWLKQSLLGSVCGAAGDCAGDDLCYLSAEPLWDDDGQQLAIVPGVSVLPDRDGGSPGDTVFSDLDGGDPTSGGPWDDLDGGGPTVTGVTTGTVVATSPLPTDCLTPLQRSLRGAVVTSPPTVIGRRKTSDGVPIWTVQFTATTQPFEYGEEVPVLAGFLDPDVDVPWAGGVVPDGGYIDLDGTIFTESECVTLELAPLTDPLCPALIAPPLPPSVPLGCFTPPKNWRRRQITIPSTYIPLWGEVVPKFQVHARDTDVRNLRLRFYADVNSDGDISDDPCAYCGDLIVSYVPQGYTLVFDTSEERIYAFDSNQQQRNVTDLVFSSDGTPFDWPVLSCGMGYIVTIDLPQTQAPPVFDLSLYPRAS